MFKHLKENMECLSPKSLEQSDKSKKYDRQLRLWGDHGQAALESSHVCLINATALGTEIIKSLVLPGIGSFTIVDKAKVTEEDVGSNFFLDCESIGKSKADIAVKLLLELNPDVHGDYVDESVDSLIENNPNFFDKFSVVIGTSLSEKEVILLSKKLWELNIPLIICRSYGFVSGARIQIKEHAVIETHPDNQTPDLRLDCPFPALKQYFDSINLDDMELKDHAHVPYVVILYKYIEEFRQRYDTTPSTYKQKEVLKELIRKGKKKDENGVPHAEENFEEALKAVNFALVPTIIPKHVLEIINDNSCANLTSKSKPFWIMVRALKDFIEGDGNNRLPVRGILPDMTAETTSYIALQQIYREQASKDAAIVYKRVQQLLHNLNLSSDSITEEDVILFCKCSSLLYILRGSSINDEYTCKKINSSYVVSELEDPDSMMDFYIMLRGIERYCTEYKEYPGELDDHVEPDIVKLKACVNKLLLELGCISVIKDDVIHEFCRYGGSELHSISAFLGGCIAHEVIKLITRQYKPFNNTLVYNGITSNVVTFVL